MAEFYTVNLSFQTTSGEQAEAVHHEVQTLADQLKARGKVLEYRSHVGRDWLAIPTATQPLRAAANKELTIGPPD
jgi:hypothetical protein